MPTIADYYKRIDAAWPADLPALTEKGAINAARRLYRFVLGVTWNGEVRVTSGNRSTWVLHGIMFVNPNRPGTEGGGWRAFIHDLSHYLHRRYYVGLKPHCREHARLELRMVKEVIRRGWLEPELPAPVHSPKPDPRIVRAARVRASIARWETKERRAKNALRKLRRQDAYYRRVLADSLHRN